MFIYVCIFFIVLLLNLFNFYSAFKGKVDFTNVCIIYLAQLCLFEGIAFLIKEVVL